MIRSVSSLRFAAHPASTHDEERTPMTRTTTRRQVIQATTLLSLTLSGLLGLGCAQAQTSSPPQRLRGSVEIFDGKTLVLKERSGEVLRLTVAANLSVAEVLPIEMSAIQPGSFIGTAAMPQADGSLSALEVLVFPEAARGTGEGHRPWDLLPGSTMTNATVADLVALANGSPQGRTLRLRYKDGEKTVIVPEGVPVVTFKPADTGLLVAGAKVIVTAELRDGTPTATRVLAGRNGFMPPM
jgi:hypothetical protein